MLTLIRRKRKDKRGDSHVLLALTRKNYAIKAEIERQKRLVKSGKQEEYDLRPLEPYITRLAALARICNAVTAPPSERAYNFATQIGKEASRISGVDFITCFGATKTKRRHVSQKLKSYDSASFEPKLKPTRLKILIVDDVIYTGRTLAETARALEELGNFVVPVALTYT